MKHGSFFAKKKICIHISFQQNSALPKQNKYYIVYIYTNFIVIKIDTRINKRFKDRDKIFIQTLP